MSSLFLTDTARSTHRAWFAILPVLALSAVLAAAMLRDGRGAAPPAEEVAASSVPIAAVAGLAAAWVADALEVPVPEVLPQIVISTPRHMARLRFGDDFTEDRADRVLALYDSARQVIHIPATWTGTEPVEMSVLVHEMVHHFQQVNGMSFPCPAAREKQAYDVQQAWLERHGETLTGSFEINPLALMLLTTCGL